MSLIADRDVGALAKAPEKRKIVFKWVLIFLAVVLALAVFVWIVSWERQQTRDALRLADMANLRAGMQSLYFEQGTFDLREWCESNGSLLSENCWAKLQNYVDADSLTMDQKGTVLCNASNCDGACQYAWGELQRDNFEIIFNLEHDVAGLSAGCHVLDRTGVR
ncbi:MAG TPA: hypothetical protein PL066_03710 [bacterium]|nr:hypothetical protein [bacterium]